MAAEQWMAAFVAGLLVGVAVGLWLAYYGFPWLDRQWNSFRRLHGRRHG